MTSCHNRASTEQLVFFANIVAVKLQNISINFAPPSKFRSFSFAAVASAGCWLETAVALDAAAAVRDGVDVLERALVQRAVRRVLARLPLLVDRVHDVNRVPTALSFQLVHVLFVVHHVTFPYLAVIV